MKAENLNRSEEDESVIAVSAKSTLIMCKIRPTLCQNTNI